MRKTAAPSPEQNLVYMQKKNSRGVRGIRLEKEDTLEHVYLPDMDGTAVYKGKEVALGRLKVAKRDGKGTKIRL